uniref:Uncharacterized protein n=1 Tax=Nelumbo nucifera TaxID=4432 RepID=A0A822YKZ6_NELNU|nr:TPA_asm: hypothetical protein HUJ06_012111 [Nelumbo nucifera]
MEKDTKESKVTKENRGINEKKDLFVEKGGSIEGKGKVKEMTIPRRIERQEWRPIGVVNKFGIISSPSKLDEGLVVEVSSSLASINISCSNKNITQEMKLAIEDALQEVFGTPTDGKNAEINVHDDLEIMGDRVIESHQKRPKPADRDTINKNLINLIRVDATNIRRFHSNLATKVTEVVQRVYETVQSDDEGSQLDNSPDNGESSSVSEELQQSFMADTPISHEPSQPVVKPTFVEVKSKRVRKPVKAMDEWPQSSPCF